MTDLSEIISLTLEMYGLKINKTYEDDFLNIIVDFKSAAERDKFIARLVEMAKIDPAEAFKVAMDFYNVIPHTYIDVAKSSNIIVKNEGAFHVLVGLIKSTRFHNYADSIAPGLIEEYARKTRYSIFTSEKMKEVLANTDRAFWRILSYAIIKTGKKESLRLIEDVDPDSPDICAAGGASTGKAC
jgi:hypothetical protein